MAYDCILFRYARKIFPILYLLYRFIPSSASACTHLSCFFKIHTHSHTENNK